MRLCRGPAELPRGGCPRRTGQFEFIWEVFILGKYFGTDGIRGIVNENLDANLAFRVGAAAAMALSNGEGKKPLFAIGKDTRISGDMLEGALLAGLCSAGADVICLGVVPTPAVAFIARDRGADAGVVISASHNPYEHNGIKFFSSAGFKLGDELEGRIEELLDHPERLIKKRDGELGCVLESGDSYVERYCRHVRSAAFGAIGGQKVLIDCANGAACRTVSRVFGGFPLELEFICDHPDGVNINMGCGSTNTALLSSKVVEGKFDLGIAFDGDADRCLVVDENGELVDGDKIIAICGVYMKEHGRLRRNTVVTTVMSNIGFHDFAHSRGIDVETTRVGDRYVLERMLSGGFVLGGEQSGHVIFLDDTTTGDGQLCAVKFLSVLSASGKKVSELVAEIPKYPQVLHNLHVADVAVRNAIMGRPALREAIREEEESLGARGRVLVRPSGTEPLIRVMVEAETPERAAACAKHLESVIRACETST